MMDRQAKTAALPRRSMLVASALSLALTACDASKEDTTANTANAAPASGAPAMESPLDQPANDGGAESRPLEATSFMGEPLLRYEVPAEKLASIAALAKPLEEKVSLSEDEYYHLGSYYVDAGRFQDAIALYTQGLDQYPDSVKLRRHRGHRYINVRDLDRAIVDLEEAVQLMGEAPENILQIGNDGKPNGTYEHWVWYHIGLYHYLNGNYADAAAAYQRCVGTATNANLRIGATDWLYNSLMKNGEPEKAVEALNAIDADIEANKNAAYYKRVMLYKGVLDDDGLIDMEKPGTEWTGGDITTGYGLANWYKSRGETDRAQAIYEKILQSPVWSGWAYVVTDKEQAGMLSR